MNNMGVSFADWCLMTKWQREDIYARHVVDKILRAKKAKQGNAGLLGAIAEKLLGF